MEIPTGMFGLLGPNGAGKSTLMRILVALMEPSSGEIDVFGYNLLKQRKEVRNILGYLPQDFRFFAKYKTYEFLDYAARLSGMTGSKQRKQAVDAMLESVGLFEVRERYANKLSGGMKRRLGIAQALIHHPKLIIVDEPTTGLDPEERIRFRNLLSKITENEVTIILSTHILPEVSMTCSRVIIINNGKVAAMDTPEGLANQMKGAERISLTIDGPGDEVRAKLLEIGGVLNVEVQKTEENTQSTEDAVASYSNYIVECQLNTDLRRTLAAEVVRSGWGLLELRSVSMSLEDVFINLVTKEE